MAEKKNEYQYINHVTKKSVYIYTSKFFKNPIKNKCKIEEVN